VSEGVEVPVEADHEGRATGRAGRIESAFAVSGADKSDPRKRAARAGFYPPLGMPSGLGPAFSFKACVNSCRLETICGAFVSTVLASFSA